MSIETLLNPVLTILPFKHFFDKLYTFGDVFNRLDFLIKEFENLKQTNINEQFVKFARYLDNLLFAKNYSVQKRESSVPSSQTYLPESDSSKFDRSTRKGSESNTINNNNSLESFDFDINSIQIETLYEKKFFISSIYLQSLIVEMSDPRRNYLAQSICFPGDSFELILPYLINMFEEPSSCIDALLKLFKKVYRFFSRGELIKKFLPIILNLLNVVDLDETVGVHLGNNEKKEKFCNLFEFTFINELRIIFGLRVFLIQICPFLVEAISGFKDFDYEEDFAENSLLEGANEKYHKENKDFIETKSKDTRKFSSLNPNHGIFGMESEGCSKVINNDKTSIKSFGEDEKRENNFKIESNPGTGSFLPVLAASTGNLNIYYPVPGYYGTEIS